MHVWIQLFARICVCVCVWAGLFFVFVDLHKRMGVRRICVRVRVCVLETVIDCDTLYGERQQARARARTFQFCIPLSIKPHRVVNGSRLWCQLSVHLLGLLR